MEELEEQMREREAAHMQERGELSLQISRLEAEVERFREEVLAWRSKSLELEQDSLRERSLREQVERELSGHRHVSRPSGWMDISPSRQDPSANGRELQTTAAQDYDRKDDSAVAMGCGNCTEDSRCECLEQVINMSTGGMVQRDLDTTPKQPHSGESVNGGHDQGNGSTWNSSDSLETDFTGLFSRKASKQRTGVIGSQSSQQRSPSMAISSGAADTDPCGFCESGTPCICAQMESPRQSQDVTTAPMSSVTSRFTPPPADGDVCRVAEPNRRTRSAQPQIGSLNSPNDVCAAGPGTCAQCRADPNSTLFCKSLAATVGSSRGGGGGGGAADGDAGCCRSGPRPGACQGRNAAASVTRGPQSASSTLDSATSRKEGTVYLSCADTYITLSRHPHYQEATDELDSWLGKLKASLPPGETDRPAIEIEAASVMGVLKFFDRRFGRE